MSVSNATNNRQATPQTAHSAKSARIRYKLQTAATSAEIGSRGADSFAQLLRKRFHRTPHHPDESDEYHFSLLAWLPRQYATDLPMIYAADDLKTGDLPFLPEQAQMHPGFDFDGPDNPDWLLQLLFLGCKKVPNVPVYAIDAIDAIGAISQRQEHHQIHERKDRIVTIDKTQVP